MARRLEAQGYDVHKSRPTTGLKESVGRGKRDQRDERVGGAECERKGKPAREGDKNKPRPTHRGTGGAEHDLPHRVGERRNGGEFSEACLVEPLVTMEKRKCSIDV